MPYHKIHPSEPKQERKLYKPREIPDIRRKYFTSNSKKLSFPRPPFVCAVIDLLFQRERGSIYCNHTFFLPPLFWPSPFHHQKIQIKAKSIKPHFENISRALRRFACIQSENFPVKFSSYFFIIYFYTKNITHEKGSVKA